MPQQKSIFVSTFDASWTESSLNVQKRWAANWRNWDKRERKAKKMMIMTRRETEQNSAKEVFGHACDECITFFAHAHILS